MCMKTSMIKSIDIMSSDCDEVMPIESLMYIDFFILYNKVDTPVIMRDDEIIIYINQVYFINNEFELVMNYTRYVLNYLTEFLEKQVSIGRKSAVLVTNLARYRVNLENKCFTRDDLLALWYLLKKWFIVCYDNYNYLAVERALTSTCSVE